MTEPIDRTKATRRRFLAGAAGLAAAGASVRAALADNAKNLPPNVPDWTRQFGAGVGDKPYGVPSKYEKDVIRRTVPWLTATPNPRSPLRRCTSSTASSRQTACASSATTAALPRSIRTTTG